MTIKQLINQDELLSAKRAFHSLFKHGDLCADPVVDAVEARCILFPVVYELDDWLLKILKKAASEAGETGTFLSEIESYDGKGWNKRHHWRMDLTTEPSYHDEKGVWIGLLENALYSEKGSWGVAVASGEFAIVAGTVSFLDFLAQHIHNLEQQVHHFLEQLKRELGEEEVRKGWPAKLLHNVSGTKKAAALLSLG